MLTALETGQVKVRATFSGAPYLWVKTVTINESYEGTYFFSNAEYGQYMQIDNNSSASAEGAYFELRDFDGATYQRFEIVYIADGYYKILSKASGKALTAPSSLDANIVQQIYTGANTQQWIVTKNSDGRFLFSPRSNPSYYMAAGDGAFTSNGRNIEMRASQSDDKDEWKLTKIQYHASVFNYYDTGYPIRYGESATVASSKIESYVDAVANQYLKIFGLELTIANATYYQSPIDICKGTVSSSNIDDICSHDGIVHSERSNVITDFYASHIGDSTTTNVLWSCHKISSTATNGETNYNRSCSYKHCIFLIEISTFFRKRDSQGVLMHEINHQYDAKDHYHELADNNDDSSCKFKDICSECGDNPRSSSCIMNNARIDISNEDVICPECQNDILTHLNNHHTN